MKLAEDLRRAVLQAAIEGKLTGGSREGWRFVRLDEIVAKRIKRGKSPKYVPHSNTLVFAQKCNTKQGNIDLSLALYLDESTIGKYPKEEFMLDGDIVLNSTGRGTLGRVGQYRITDNPQNMPLVPDSHVTIIRPMQNISSKYICYVLKNYQQYIETLGEGTTNQTELSAKKVASLTIPLPPIEEQHRIVSRLDAILSLIAELEAAENELEILERKFPCDMRDSLLQAAIQGKLTGSNTDNWQRVRLRDISLSVQYGYNAPAREGGTVKMIRITDIQNNNVQWDNVPYCEISEDEMQKYLLAKNDILFARTGGTVGKSYLVDDMPEKAIYAGYLIRMRLKDEVNPQYVKYFMESESYWKQLRNGTTATAQPNCNGRTLSQILIPLPPIEEQHKIVSRLNELLPLCESFEK